MASRVGQRPLHTGLRTPAGPPTWIMVRHRLRNLSLHCMLLFPSRRGSCTEIARGRQRERGLDAACLLAGVEPAAGNTWWGQDELPPGRLHAQRTPTTPNRRTPPSADLDYRPPGAQPLALHPLYEGVDLILSPPGLGATPRAAVVPRDDQLRVVVAGEGGGGCDDWVGVEVSWGFAAGRVGGVCGCALHGLLVNV
jgi:hypothetical protein